MDKNSIGLAIKERREGMGLSQNSLAVKMTLATGKQYRISIIRAIEEGSRSYTVDSLLICCKALDLELKVL